MPRSPLTPCVPFLPAALCAAALLAVAAFGAAPGPESMTNMQSSLATQRAWTLTLGTLTLGATLLGATWAILLAARNRRALGAAQDRLAALLAPGRSGAAGNDNSVPDLPGFDAIFVSARQLLQDREALAGKIQTLEADLAAEARRREDMARRAEASRCQSLRSAASTLGAAIADIHGSAADLESAAQGAARGAGEQRQLAAETATAMEQMNASVAQVAQGAESAALAARQAMEQAGAGAGAVEETVAAIQAVRERTVELGAVVQGLGAQAENIGQIIGVINDIADQTNLLALNAAIEAARAGDAGRGFAVVADEVRKLAEKTMAATRDVGTQIEGIQQGVGRTRSGMEQAAHLVGQATDIARRSGDMLTAIVGLAGENAGQIQSIASASEQPHWCSTDMRSARRHCWGRAANSAANSSARCRA